MNWQNLPVGKKIIMDDFNNPNINWLNDTSVHGLEKQLTDTINGFFLEHLTLEYRGGGTALSLVSYTVSKNVYSLGYKRHKNTAQKLKRVPTQ